MTSDTIRSPIRVVLVDDHAVVRAGLRALLSTSADIVVVGEASNGREAIAAVEALTPDVAVMDLDMPQMDGLTATQHLVATKSATRILILTMQPADDTLITLLEAGAAGFITKSLADRQIADAVRAVAAGDTYVHPTAARALARHVTRPTERTRTQEQFQALSARERDVLALVGGGYSAVEIGERLCISPKTVETYKQRVSDKLGLAHRSDYVQLCLRLGLLQQTS